MTVMLLVLGIVVGACVPRIVRTHHRVHVYRRPNSKWRQPMFNCPWCHHADTLTLTKNGWRNWNVTCDCGASGPDAETEEGAVRAWNFNK